MKKGMFKNMAMLVAAGMLMTSCYTYTSTVGQGAQGNTQVKAWNHYVIYGLAPVGVSDSNEMAGGADNYDVTVKHSFVNGLIAGLTFGIYTPTTTIVTK